MTKKTMATGLAFAVALALNAGPNGLEWGARASAQNLTPCVGQTARILGNPVNYAGAKYAGAVSAKIKAIKLNLKQISLEACKAARGNTKKAVTLGKNDVAAMLMGLRNPTQAGGSPSPHQKPTPQQANNDKEKKAQEQRAKMEEVRAKHLAAQKGMLLKKQVTVFKAQCAGVRMESSKLAMQAKAVKDAKLLAAFKERLRQANILTVQCGRIDKAVAMHADYVGENKKIDPKALEQTIKGVESMQKEIRKKRKITSTVFQNFDQKTNQLANILSQVMKAMNETRMDILKNLR